MRLADAKLLFDISVRLQIFTEGVKVSEARQFDALLVSAELEFRKVLNRIQYATLDALTKMELNKLVLTLRQSQSTLYSIYLDNLLKRLEKFMQAAMKVNRIVYTWADLQLESDKDIQLLTDEEASDYIEAKNKKNTFIALYGLAVIKRGNSTLWPKILNEPMPSNGAHVKPFVQAWSASSQVNLENTLRKAYANSLTPTQTMTEAQRVLNVAKAQSTAVMATAMQHVASIVSASITSGLFGQYQWISVIDSNTTEICISRNGHVYEYGKGPIPPAHIRCRSHIMPFKGGQTAPQETFYSFVKRQPKDIQNIALGNKTADLLRTEKLKAKDITKLTDPKSMTVDDFANSASQIVGLS